MSNAIMKNVVVIDALKLEKELVKNKLISKKVNFLTDLGDLRYEGISNDSGIFLSQFIFELEDLDDEENDENDDENDDEDNEKEPDLVKIVYEYLKNPKYKYNIDFSTQKVMFYFSW